MSNVTSTEKQKSKTTKKASTTSSRKSTTSKTKAKTASKAVKKPQKRRKYNYSGKNNKKKHDYPPKYVTGRPPKYLKKYVKDIIVFFSIEHTQEKSVVTKDGGVRTVTLPNKLPTLEAFAVKHCNCDTSTLRRWVKKYPEFRTAYSRAKELQKDMLVHLGMIGLYNANFTKFVAKNITDMTEETKTDITTGGEKIVNINTVLANMKNKTDEERNRFV